MTNYLTEFQMNQYFGWIQGSDMPATYVHMSGREVDDAILTMNGIKPDVKNKDIETKPLICPRCDTINVVDSKHCNKCGGILDVKVAMEIEEQEKRHKEDLIKDADARKNSDGVMRQLLNNEQ